MGSVMGHQTVGLLPAPDCREHMTSIPYTDGYTGAATRSALMHGNDVLLAFLVFALAALALGAWMSLRDPKR
jgi:hypothetical protein